MTAARKDARPGALSHLLYLHGFRSSPQSTKAKKIAAWVAAHRPDLVWCCPQLPASPAAAMAEVLAGIAAWPHARMAVIGS
ncbi:MAG TPA: YqiA/YcfP family alpha/beta fold hydrolase, partial [Caldimonas sp.]